MAELTQSDVRAISARIDRLPASGLLWGLVARVSLGAFFEIYETALTGLLPAGLVAAGLFQKGRAGLFGLPDIASFAFATFAGLFAGALSASWLADRIGRRPVFVWSVVWYAAATALMLFQDKAVAFCALRFVSAIGVGASIVTVDAYLAEMLPRQRRGRGFAISKSIQYLAVPLAGLVALLARHDPFGVAGWRWMLLPPILGGALIFLIARRLPESPRWLAAHGRQDEASWILAQFERRLGQPAARSPDAILFKADSAGTHSRFADLFRRPLLSRTLMMIVTSCCSTIAYFGFGNWLPSLLEARHVEITKSLLYVTLIGLSYPVAPLVFGRWGDTFERKTQLIAGAVLTTAAGIAFAFQSSGAGWLIAGLLVTTGNNLCSYAAHTYRSELFPTAIRARAIGFIYSLDRLTAAFSNYLIAFLLVEGGVGGVLGCIVAFSIAGMVVVALFGPRTLRNGTPSTGDRR